MGDPRRALDACAEAARAAGARFVAAALFVPGALAPGAPTGGDFLRARIPSWRDVEAFRRAASEIAVPGVAVIPGIGIVGRFGVIAGIGGSHPGAGLPEDPVRAIARLHARGAAVCLLRPLGSPPASGLPILLACALPLDACDTSESGAARLLAHLRSMGLPIAAIATPWALAAEDLATSAPLTYVSCTGDIDADSIVAAVRRGRTRTAPVRVEVRGRIDVPPGVATGIEVIDVAGRVAETIESHSGEPFEISPSSRLRIHAPGHRLATWSPLGGNEIGRLLDAVADRRDALLEPEIFEQAREILARADLRVALEPIEPPPLQSWHTHTFHSACGLLEMDPIDVLALARLLGYEALAFTDHIVRGEDNLSRILAVRERCEAARAAGRVPARILVGGEFEVLRPGHVWVPDEIADACDIVIVSPNHYHLHDVAAPPATDIGKAAAHELAMIESAVRHPRTDVVAHPFVSTLQVFPADRLFDAADPYHLDDLLAIARERGVAMEISPKAFSLAAGEGLAPFYAMVREAGVAIAPGSDAHSLDAIWGWSRAFGEIARVLSIDRKEVWPGPHAR